MPIQDGLQATLQIRRIERGRLRRQASRASFVKDLVLVGEGRQVSLSQRHCTCPSQMPVPIVGVSACGKSEQLGNAFSSGLLHDITGQSLFCLHPLHSQSLLACRTVATFNTDAGIPHACVRVRAYTVSKAHEQEASHLNCHVLPVKISRVACSR